MWDFIRPVSLIRYLVVWQLNSSLVQLPRYLPTELSQTLGTLIANRLPTPQARDWRKAMAVWDQTAAAISADDRRSPSIVRRAIPDVSWPIESVLFVYPGKRAYGQGEMILWDLKLLGDSADHGLFLEFILPAMEEAATTSDPRWQRPNSLWGHFDIRAIYAARGSRWEPFVSEGRLNLEYRATSTQWAEGLAFGLDLRHRFQHLTWIMPFDLATTQNASDSPRPSSKAPTLHNILDALMERMTLFLPGKRRVAADAWAQLNTDEQTALWLALEQSLPQRSSLDRAPREWPGRWIGTQTFKTIPARLLPYLELASILHIGRQTHLGCGTFRLS
jgi:hypothetical protein